MRPAPEQASPCAGYAASHGEHVADARVAVLDAARALAILGVIGVHLGLWMPNLPHWLSATAAMGQYGVQLFFVISAITISYTLDADERRYGATVQTVVRRFYIKRIVRIVPLYYAAILTYGVLDYLAHLAHGQINLPHHLPDVAANLLFIHGWVPSAINSVVPGGWSIGVEMSFYALAPFILHASRTQRSVLLTGLFMLITGAAVAVAGACFQNAACRIGNNGFLYFWLPVQLPCFVFGLWLARFGMPLLTGKQTLSRRSLLAVTVAGALSLALLYEVGAGAELAHGFAPAAAALAAICLLIVGAHLPARWLHVPMVLRFGEQSYGVYLWSAAVVAVVRALLKTPLGQVAKHYPSMSFLAAVLAVSVLCYAAAVATSRWIDRPVGDWARRILLGRGGLDMRRRSTPRTGGEPVD